MFNPAAAAKTPKTERYRAEYILPLKNDAIYADFDEHNKRTSNECRIFDIWDIPKEV